MYLRYVIPILIPLSSKERTWLFPPEVTEETPTMLYCHIQLSFKHQLNLRHQDQRIQELWGTLKTFQN